MALPAPPPPAKLICGMISADTDLFALTQAELEKVFGSVDIVSEIFPFDFTHYYDQEMGSPLMRRFISFAAPVSPDILVGAKHLSNELEARFGKTSAGGELSRRINLDPGIVEGSHLILASMKNFSHRIYLSRGVFADLTLMYHREGVWKSLPWTFPDYASGRYFPFLTAARDALRRFVKEGE